MEERRERSRNQSRGKERFKKGEEIRIAESHDNAPVKEVIHTIAGGLKGGDSSRPRKKYDRYLEPDSRRYQVLSLDKEEEIIFENRDLGIKGRSQNKPMVIKMDIANFVVHTVLVHNRSSIDILFMDVLRKMEIEPICDFVCTPSIGFGGSEVFFGTIDLLISIGEEPKKKTMMVKFLVVDTPFAYNVILGCPGLNLFKAVVSSFHLKMKFPTAHGIGEVKCDQKDARRYCNLSIENGTKERMYN
ncbi:UNVERIFIED_CONTAM: hypothetical protein Sradi_2385800 [Sesamum radiatum]|uniref:Uncharacterized protein n=1 Tax=Sesamum radiatum TaxID=300843 RepID=A0AAW2T7R5_SESRA